MQGVGLAVLGQNAQVSAIGAVDLHLAAGAEDAARIIEHINHPVRVHLQADGLVQLVGRRLGVQLLVGRQRVDRQGVHVHAVVTVDLDAMVARIGHIDQAILPGHGPRPRERGIATAGAEHAKVFAVQPEHDDAIAFAVRQIQGIV